VQQDTPRLVVQFQRDGDQENYQWGMVGAMPLLSLIGYVGRVQVAFANLDNYFECDESALVIAYHKDGLVSMRGYDGVETPRHIHGGDFSWYVHPDIPTDSLCGFLELVKTALVGTMAAKQAVANQVGIVGADGRPVKRRKF
jgi:hypothetical protein